MLNAPYSMDDAALAEEIRVLEVEIRSFDVHGIQTNRGQTVVFLLELQRYRATMKRIEEWADELDGSAYCLLGSRGIAAELRKAIKGEE